MLAGYFSMLFEQVEWGELDFLIFDLPPGTGDIQLTLTQKIPLTGAVVVTTPQEIALADVRRAIAMFRKVNVDVLGIVENMSYFSPPELPDNKYYIFGKEGGKKVAQDYHVSLLGEIPLDIEMREGNDSGKPAILNEKVNRYNDEILLMAENTVKEIRRANNRASAQPGVKISL
jgi:ATP-binding protein involved in chromosome partitioning